MATPTVEGFSVSHAAILNGTTGAEEAAGDIYGVRSSSMEVDSDSYDNTGDDSILSTWNWVNAVNLSIQSGYISFQTIELMSGVKMTSSGAAGSEYFSLPLFEERSFNPAPKPVLVRIPSKDKDGVPRTLDIVLFKVQFAPMSFDGPTYKDGMTINYTGRALISPKDEKGAPILDSNTGLPSRSFGRLLSRPQV